MDRKITNIKKYVLINISQIDVIQWQSVHIVAIAIFGLTSRSFILLDVKVTFIKTYM